MEALAILGLIYAAKSCDKNEETYELEQEPQKIEKIEPTESKVDENMSRITNTFTGDFSDDRGLSGVGIQNEVKDSHPSFGVVAPDASRNPFGQPVNNFRDRPYVSNQMNNLGPVVKELVGPGLGVSSDVPAVGGYQQLYRVNPTNVGAYKLTTLPGRIAPGGNTTGGMPGKVGELTAFPKHNVSYLPDRRPEVKGRAQGQGGALTGQTHQEQYLKTKRMTNRAETTTRSDGLEFRPAKSFVSSETLHQDATRNKGDLNAYQYRQAAPGVSNFNGGYTVAPESMFNDQGCKNSQAFGIRPADRRGKAARQGNAGRMNVRAGPLNAGGMVTAVRSDTSRIDGRNGPANGGWSQNYVQPMYNQFNSFKGQANPRAGSSQLNIADRNLTNNPLANTIA